MTEDFYALLEVPEDASQDDIRDAFREKVREYHPDHNDDPRANAQFTAVKKAYDTLGDPVERNAYDRMGHVDYVSKRLDGLPDPDKWAPSQVEEGSPSGGTAVGTGSSTGTGGTSAGASGSTRSSGSRGRAGSSTGGRTSPGSSGTSTGRRTGATGTGARSSTASSTTGGSSGSAGPGRTGSSRRTASDGAGATVGSRGRQPHQSPIVTWIARHGLARRLVGWPLLAISVALYVVGLVSVASAHRSAVGGRFERLLAAGADVDALSAALDRGALPTVYDAAVGPLLVGDGEPVALAGGALLVVGAALLPLVVGLLVYLTRMSPGWRPSYLYPVALLGPIGGLAVGAVTDVPLAAELGLFLLLPALALLTMLLSAFVRPRVKAAIAS